MCSSSETLGDNLAGASDNLTGILFIQEREIMPRYDILDIVTKDYVKYIL